MPTRRNPAADRHFARNDDVRRNASGGAALCRALHAGDDGDAPPSGRRYEPREHSLFASKSALDIEGLSEKNVELLVSTGLVKSLSDLYRLTKEKLLKLERFAEVSAKKLVDNIEKSKTPPLAKFITALGIRHVGTQTAISLANRFKSIENLKTAEKDDLLEIPDIGEVVAESILAFFADEDNLKMLDELTALGLSPTFTDTSKLPLAGKSYIISGTLESYSREAAEDELRKLGATVTSSVTKSTTALILGAKPGASKLAKAEKLKIPTLSESEFLALLES